MPTSSTGVVYNGSDKDTKPCATDDSSHSHNGSIDRFLADQDQYHPAFSKVWQSPAEAVAAAEARMAAELLAFEKKFGSSDKTPNK